MAKTYDITTNVGKVRLYTAETTVATTRYTDEEIELFISEASNDLYMAAALFWEAKASYAASKAVQKSIGKLSVNKGITAEYALKMAETFREKAGSVPCAETAEMGITDFQINTILTNLETEG